MQGDRGHKGAVLNMHGPNGLTQPVGGGFDDVLPVAMFQAQDQMAGLVAIDQGGASLFPGWGRGQTGIAMQHFIYRGFPGQWDTATVADGAANEGRFAPTCGAKTEVTVHHRAASDTVWRVEGLQSRLKSLPNTHINPNMTELQTLTDRQALMRNRMRARELFLQEHAAHDLQSRLSMVNKAFTAPAIVTPFPQVWQGLDGRVVPDAETLDLEPGQHDLVVHSMSLHWANDPVGQLIQCRRALRADGLLLVASLGGQTLQELRACLAEAEVRHSGGLSPRVAPMGEIRDLGALLQRAGFALPVADSETLEVAYRDAFHLMRDLRAMGEGNALQARLRHPTRRAVFTEAAELYAQHHSMENGRVRATFEVVTLTGWAPDASQQQPLRPGSATNRLSEALGSTEHRLKD